MRMRVNERIHPFGEYRSKKVRLSSCVAAIMGIKVAQQLPTTRYTRGRMAFMAYKQQTMALGMAVLLLAAVVAPMCVMFAQPAMAMAMPMSAPMPDEVPAPVPQDCDSGDSLAECPHLPADSARATAPRVDLQSEMALPMVSHAHVVPVDFGPVEAPLCNGQLPPPGHLTPLRL